MHPHLGQRHLGRQRQHWGQAPKDERSTRKQGGPCPTFTARGAAEAGALQPCQERGAKGR